MLQSPLFWYGIAWISVKYATFAKGWDLLTVSIAAAAVLIVGILLWDLFLSMLRQGKDNIVFPVVMTLGGITFIADEFFHVGWYIKFGNPTIDFIVGWGLVIGMSLFTVYVFYLKIAGYREEDEE